MGLSLTDDLSLDENGEGLTYTYDSEAYGPVVGGGLNVTLNIDMALGLRYSYYMGESDARSKKDDGENDIEYDDSDFNTNYTGGSVMLQFIYTPKALGFDPVSALGNLSD